MRGCATTSPPSATGATRSPSRGPTRSPSARSAEPAGPSSKHPGLDPDADIRQVLDDDDDVPDGFELVSSWVYVGQGYLDLDQAAAAVRSAAISRTRERRPRSRGLPITSQLLVTRLVVKGGAQRSPKDTKCP